MTQVGGARNKHGRFGLAEGAALSGGWIEAMLVEGISPGCRDPLESMTQRSERREQPDEDPHLRRLNPAREPTEARYARGVRSSLP